MEEQIIHKSINDNPVIEVVNVKKSYQLGKMEVVILHDINLSVRSGEFLAIMGPSGSGKSTLMNLIGCLDRPTAGQIIVRGRDINKITDNELAHLRGEDDYGSLFAMASSMDTIQATSDDLDQKLGRHFGVPSRDMDNDDAKPYLIFNQAEILEETDQLAGALTALLTSVALIALIVGSIGIMNIMLVSVTERTREIGILKSLGFRNSNVLFLFIVESIVLSVIGGLLGIGLGVLGAYGAQSLMALPIVFPVELILIGFVVSVIVGLIAGVYPANKAAKMNTVDALRH